MRMVCLGYGLYVVASEIVQVELNGESVMIEMGCGRKHNVSWCDRDGTVVPVGNVLNVLVDRINEALA